MLAILNPIRIELSRRLPGTQTNRTHRLNTLLTDLTDPQPEIRRAAVVSLGEERNPSTIPHLARRLDDPHASVRYATIDALGWMNHPDTIPYLVPLLDSQSPRCRTSALMALAWTNAETATVALVRALAHPDPDIQELATSALVNRHDSGTVSWLLAYLCSQHDEESVAAHQVLARMGESAVQPLVTLVCGPDAGIRALAASVLIDIGQPALPILYLHCKNYACSEDARSMIDHVIHTIEKQPAARHADA